MMQEEDTFCGFICSDVTERVQIIVQDIKDFSEYNPETALEVLGKLDKMLNDAKIEITFRTKSQ